MEDDPSRLIANPPDALRSQQGTHYDFNHLETDLVSVAEIIAAERNIDPSEVTLPMAVTWLSQNRSQSGH